MSYLKRPILTLVLNRFKTSAEGWRSGRATMTQYSRYVSAKGTTWAYWERIKSVWKRLWVPESSHVTGMCNSCTLIVLSIRASILFIVPLSRFQSHVTGMCNSCTLIVLSIGASILFIAHAIIALPLRFVGLFALIPTSTLRCHWDCACRSVPKPSFLVSLFSMTIYIMWLIVICLWYLYEM